MTNQEIDKAITEKAIKARQELWREYGESHDLEELKGLYRKWLETSIENLLEECMPIAAGGTNRHELFANSFHNAIAKLEPSRKVEDEYDQWQFDQVMAA